MAFLNRKILLLIMTLGLPLVGWAQSFLYSYVDPCTKQTKFINADMNSPVFIVYYGQTRTFNYTELQDGTFELWMNDIYIKYKTTSPCQGAAVTTTTTTSTNTVSNIIGNVTSLINLDFSSVTSGVSGGVGTNIGSTTSSGTGGIGGKKNDSKNSSNSSNSSSSNNSSSSGSSGNNASNNPTSGSQTGENRGNPPENQGGSSSNGEGGVTNDGNSSSGSSGSGSNSSGTNNGSSGSNGSSGNKTEEPKTEKPTEEKIEDTKTETQKQQSQTSAKAASKAKAETQKPAILVTGDIVGVQTRSNGAQDARGTASFTRVKGDGTASIGFSADYMVNARIGNISAIRSWIGTNTKGHKHINVVSDGISLMPGTITNTALFIRVNSLKNLTAMYGAAATYGKMYGEEMISTIAIGGFMYKGKLAKSLDATIIMAGIYAPYTKYYTESLFEAKPIIIPFLNLNYKLTKTFGMGLTAGGTYVATQDILNFQILMGAKLKI
jgi:hypothetical protein